ncbi:hypothetical protein Tcan_16437 [Toxocara canis]|uniref:Uncharacterized protein n=1 Tax=Toxocara canis TaxID=6265 RepID=A0A0B2UVN1_TOXCA|nr:hypothetical protein Tcan_16437 [Toxocara canis]
MKPSVLVIGEFGTEQPTCSGERCYNDVVLFHYEWPVKVCRRLIGAGDSLILNLSPAFSTAFNGVMFTWALRLSDESVACELPDTATSDVNVFLYYKDGPTQDVNIIEAKIDIADGDGVVLFSGMSIDEDEWTKGSGWPARTDREQQNRFTKFVRDNVDKVIRIRVTFSMCLRAFLPLLYFPQVDHANRLVESACQQYLKDFDDDRTNIPDLDVLDEEADPFAAHRLIFLHGCKEIAQRLQSNGDCDIKQVFANIYFTEYLLPNVQYFEDFIEVLEGTRAHHITALYREAERFICREIIEYSHDETFVKKMLLLGEHYQLPVLKMMCSGILAERIVEHSNSLSRIRTISEEMRQIAKQINFIDEESSSEESDSDSLVDSVVEELKILTKRMRRVSMSSNSE